MAKIFKIIRNIIGFILLAAIILIAIAMYNAEKIENALKKAQEEARETIEREDNGNTNSQQKSHF